MKKIKCLRCFQTQSEKAFKEKGEMQEWCKTCRAEVESARRRAVEKLILNYAQSIGLTVKKP